MTFHSRLESEIFKMKEELNSETYQWGLYRHFWVTDPKLRLIESAPFRDRIVHQAIIEVLEPWLDPSFYFHSYACRSGKGTHIAARTLSSWIAKHPDALYLQMDVSKFFPSVDRDTLYLILESKIAEGPILRLIHSLIHCGPGVNGIPIGNLTSQLFANVYLDRLDQYLKRTLRVKHYIRYMDDFVILHPRREYLQELRLRIEEFGWTVLKLKFNPSKVILGKTKEDIRFVGFRCTTDGMYLKGKSVRRFRKRLKQKSPLDKKLKLLLSYSAHARHSKDALRLVHDFKHIAFPEGRFESLLGI